MKSEVVIKAEQEARQACEGLGHTEEQIQAFVEEHISNELRRDAEKAKELQRPKRNADLTKAVINIALDPFLKGSDAFFPSYSTKQSFIMSTEKMMAAYHERKRNRGET